MSNVFPVWLVVSGARPCAKAALHGIRDRGFGSGQFRIPNPPNPFLHCDLVSFDKLDPGTKELDRVPLAAMIALGYGKDR